MAGHKVTDHLSESNTKTHREMVNAAKHRMMALLYRFPSQWLLQDDVMCAGFQVEMDDPNIGRWKAAFSGALDRMRRKIRTEGIYKITTANGSIRLDPCSEPPKTITRRQYQPACDPQVRPAFVGHARFYPGSQPRYGR